MLTLGSLFDGIGGFPLAATRAGIQPLWASEINPFGIKVTSHHFPEMTHVGDVSNLSGSDLEPVDIISFGSPCQDFSVAGLRAGLVGVRSGLFAQAIRIAGEMRIATNGQYPKYLVWENVPGVFSANKGSDFENVIAALAGYDQPIPLPAGKGRTAGLVRGADRSVEWCVLDAQHFGVPQRRRRVFAVVHFGGRGGGQILFERDGLQGDYQPRRQARSRHTRGAEVSAGVGDGLIAFGHTDSLSGGGITTSPDTAPTMRCSGGNGSLSIAFSHKDSGQDSGLEIAPTLRSMSGSGSRGSSGGSAAIAFGFDSKATIGSDDTSLPLRVQNSYSSVGVLPPLAFAQNQRSEVRDLGGVAGALAAQPGMKQQTFIAIDARNAEVDAETTMTLQSNSYKSLNGLPLVASVKPQCRPRRLSPLECERLQGFPDGWTDLSKYDKPRYEALGNTVAVPVVQWIMGQLKRDHDARL